MGTGRKSHEAGMQNPHFYKKFRHIVGLQIPRRSVRERNALNRPPGQTIVCSPELCGRPRQNVMLLSEQYSELSNDYYYDNISDHDSEDENPEHLILVDTDKTTF